MADVLKDICGTVQDGVLRQYAKDLKAKGNFSREAMRAKEAHIQKVTFRLYQKMFQEDCPDDLPLGVSRDDHKWMVEIHSKIAEHIAAMRKASVLQAEIKDHEGGIRTDTLAIDNKWDIYQLKTQIRRMKKRVDAFDSNLEAIITAEKAGNHELKEEIVRKMRELDELQGRNSGGQHRGGVSQGRNGDDRRR